jgi:hypothetical protein
VRALACCASLASVVLLTACAGSPRCSPCQSPCTPRASVPPPQARAVVPIVCSTDWVPYKPTDDDLTAGELLKGIQDEALLARDGTPYVSEVLREARACRRCQGATQDHGHSATDRAWGHVSLAYGHAQRGEWLACLQELEHLDHVL